MAADDVLSRKMSCYLLSPVGEALPRVPPGLAPAVPGQLSPVKPADVRPRPGLPAFEPAAADWPHSL